MNIVTLRDMLLDIYSKQNISELNREAIKRDAEVMVSVCAEESLNDEIIDIVADSVAWRVLD